ncbi:MAG: hypothetical protein HFG54_10215 [Lachnospiraceae bacterium]|jgi:hypothetical protein|nr:hypothetical protein [Lachnospiraceae bacterium]
MILGDLKRNHVADDKLWELVERANQLTTGSYGSWDENGPVLVPLMERILAHAKEKEDWLVYFFDMSRLFWLVRRSGVNDLRRAFQLAELFHRDNALHVGEQAGSSAQEWRVQVTAQILGFYLGYPQIDDGKIQHMLDIFREFHERYGSEWNNGDYQKVMSLAKLNRDKELAKEAKRKLERGDYENWCYVCYYGLQMIGYYVLCEDPEGVEEMIGRLCERVIPVKYRWCYNLCESAKEEELVYEALLDCLKIGRSRMFARFFARWQHLYETSEAGGTNVTHRVLFHSLAGDWSDLKERLRLAEKDDQDKREGKETPLDCLYWSLCWYCYFQMLERQGTGTVWMKLGEDESREWTCLEVTAYFEKQADLLGEQMDQARKRFEYDRVKRTYEECFLGVQRDRG